MTTQRKCLSFVLGCLLVCAARSSFAQGCSDAGFCTVGSLHQLQAEVTGRHRLSIGFFAGVGDENVFVFTPSLQYDRQFNRMWSFQAKLTANYADGNLGNAVGPGDLFISGTKVFNPGAGWQWSATLGTKLPFNRSNLKKNGRSLPMQYQSSLGTVDAIAGLSVNGMGWQFSAGYQQPLTGSNLNGFLPAYWADNSDADKYPSSLDLNRKADVLLRAFYEVTSGSKFQFGAGLLGIYHLGQDTYINASISNSPIKINGSDGLTLNITGSARWRLSKGLQIGVIAGAPVVARDVRPDGLTRSFAVSPEIIWSF